MAHDKESKSQLGRIIAANIKRHREDQGVLCWQMGAALGIDASSYSRIETGERRITLVEGVAAAERLGVSLDVLCVDPDAAQAVA